jgi:LacI family transcriptional regulator
MAVTLKDIATEVGLSHVTVSKVLRGAGSISEETRKRVFAVAERLRYRPHGLAKSMRDGRTGIVGLIYSPEGTSRALTDAQLIGIQTALADRSYELMLGMVPRAALTARGKTSALLRHWMADGLLINHHIGLPDQVAELVEGDHVPAIWMNSKQSRNCVYFDDFGGAAAAVDYLVSLGHRRIVYADFSHARPVLFGNEHYSIRDRYEGYLHAMRKHGLAADVWVSEGPLSGDRRVNFAVDCFRRATQKPTAIICYGQIQTLHFMAAHERLRIPADLSLISFAGERDAVNDLVSTLVYQSYQQMGESAVEALLRRIATTGRQAAGESSPVILPLQVAAGETVSPLPHGEGV